MSAGLPNEVPALVSTFIFMIGNISESSLFHSPKASFDKVLRCAGKVLPKGTAERNLLINLIQFSEMVTILVNLFSDKL